VNVGELLVVWGAWWGRADWKIGSNRKKRAAWGGRHWADHRLVTTLAPQHIKYRFIILPTFPKN